MVTNSSWHSYPSSFNLGHRAIKNLFDVPVVVEEKVDGSQFSFGKFPEFHHLTGEPTGDYELKIRSKGCVMNIDAPEKMFNKAAETVKAIADQLTVGWTYRAEYLQKPKHNTLVYTRVPNQHLIIFDINRGDQDYLSYDEKFAEAQRLGLECVPRLYEGVVDHPDKLRLLFHA